LKDRIRKKDEIINVVEKIFDYYSENFIHRYRYDNARKNIIRLSKEVKDIKTENAKLLHIFRRMRIDYGAELNAGDNKS
jgi:hypothetical protein